MIHSLFLSPGFFSQAHLWTKWKPFNLLWFSHIYFFLMRVFKGLIHNNHHFWIFMCIIGHGLPCLSSPCSSSELRCKKKKKKVGKLGLNHADFLLNYYMPSLPPFPVCQGEAELPPLQNAHLHHPHLQRASCHPKWPLRGSCHCPAWENPVMLKFNYFFF